MDVYETQSGETWDSIAYEVYGNEMQAGYLMQNNPHLLGTVIFQAGTLIYCPPLPDAEEELPDWRD